MNTVYVMNEKEKEMAGCLVLILLLAIGGWFGFKWLFPSAEDRLHSAQTAERQLESSISQLQLHLASLEAQTKEGKLTTANALERAGERLKRARDERSSAVSAREKLLTLGSKLEKHGEVDMQLRGKGFVKRAEEAAPVLEKLSVELDSLEQKVQQLSQ